jgi:hypothetical protein
VENRLTMVRQELALFIGCSLLLTGCSPNGQITADTEDKKMPESDKVSEQQTAPPDMIKLAGVEEPRGVRVNKAGNLPGYIMYTPLVSDTTYLIDREGNVVHTWKSDYAPSSEYLVNDGLIRGARVPDAPRFFGGGQGGRIEKLSWHGDLVWSFEQADERRLFHHDFEVMPNGNILSLCWEAKTREESLQAGRNPDNTPQAGLWPDMIVEIEPSSSGGKVIWEWHTWDHMIQNHDADLPDYGEPGRHPRKIDINAGPALTEITAQQLAQAKKIGQAPGNATLEDWGADMYHSNAIDYNAALDQIAISVRSLSEIWVIDHGLTTAEAEGDAGDLLYRWGSPNNYGVSDSADGLGHQHDVRWIPAGYPGAGNIMIFSNDAKNAAPPRSEVVEITRPLNADGTYTDPDDSGFGPTQPVWRYSDGNFYSPFISGAHRSRNGNTLVTFGPQGRFVEVTPEGDIVWEYWTPYSGEVRMPDGSLPQPARPFMYAVFRATFVPEDHPALIGKDLTPLDPQPEPSLLREEELAPFRMDGAR